MRRAAHLVPAGVLLMAGTLPAMAVAQTMAASRPGLMCTEPGALAALTLPDGSNRGASPHARQDDEAIKQQGGCIDIPQDARVAVHQRRINTSIVSFDAGDGRGERDWIVPNIDFAMPHSMAAEASSTVPPASDPVDAFFTALAATCPGHDWQSATMESYGAPLEEAAKSLTPEQHAALSRDVAAQCQPSDGLECGNTVSIRLIAKAGRLVDLSRAFCAVAPSTAKSVRY